MSHESSTNGLISQSTPILNEDGDPIWKVLVFDNMGRDVISSVLRVNDLRAWGVTIHLYVCSQDAVPCSSCIYCSIATDRPLLGTSTLLDTQFQMFLWST